MAQRIDRKDLKGPDEFVEGASRLARLVRDNRNSVIAGAVALSVLFIGAVSYTSYHRRSLHGTAAAFLRATDALESDNLESADTAMRTVAASEIEPYDQLARLYIADIQARKGNYADAIAAYAEVAAEARVPYLEQIALIGKAHALEVSGEPGDAEAAYVAAAKIDGPHRQSALRSQLRTARAAGDEDTARAALTAILADYPSVSDAAELTRQLEALGG